MNEGKSPLKRVFRSQTADKIRSKNEVGFSSIRGGDVVVNTQSFSSWTENELN